MHACEREGRGAKEGKEGQEKQKEQESNNQINHDKINHCRYRKATF